MTNTQTQSKQTSTPNTDSDTAIELELDTKDTTESNDDSNTQNNTAENNGNESDVENMDITNPQSNDNVNNDTDNHTALTQTTPPEMKKTDIVIAGVTYQIYCPIDGEEELRSAVYSINNFVLDIKKQSPKLSQENLLLLCCLNLSEQLHSQQATEDSRRQDHDQSMALLQKIIKDAQSIG